jgi:single-strand DNA-binding protein
MNSCILMADIVKAPELRYTQDGQMAIAEMMVQIPPLRANDPVSNLKVVAWGNLGQQVQEQCREGDTVVIEGRLSMNTIDRPEGYKEKVAEFTVSRLHPVSSTGMSISGGAANAMGTGSAPAPAQPIVAAPAAPTNPPKAAPVSSPGVEPNFDDIPF